jgi:hypothetical protein
MRVLETKESLLIRTFVMLTNTLSKIVSFGLALLAAPAPAPGATEE